MPYLALKAHRFGAKNYSINEAIADSDIDPKMAKTLEEMGMIKAMPTIQTAESGPTAMDVMITSAQNFKAEVYTPESYKVLTDATAEAVKLASSKKTTPDEINAQLTVMNDAMKALVPATAAEAVPADDKSKATGEADKAKGSVSGSKAG